jgi:hypothetical protein
LSILCGFQLYCHEDDHFINRNTGLPAGPGCPVIDEVPAVGPVKVTMKCTARPKSVRLAFEKGAVEWTQSRGMLTATISTVRLHAALVVE